MQQHTNTSKRPPQAIEVERGILGAMMVVRESLSVAFEHLTEDEFYNPKHKKIFKVIKSLYLNNDPVDAVSVVSKGLDDYVYTLTAEPVSDIEYYCGVLIEKSKKRKLIQVG